MRSSLLIAVILLATSAVAQENDRAIGLVASDVPLTLVAVNLEWGKWFFGPAGSIEAGSERRLFEAWGRKNSATGTGGAVEYQTPDGAVFQLSFDVPYSRPNACAMKAVSGPVSKYKAAAKCSPHGKSCEIHYTLVLAR